jgi:hypothetical protein
LLIYFMWLSQYEGKIQRKVKAWWRLSMGVCFLLVVFLGLSGLAYPQQCQYLMAGSAFLAVLVDEIDATRIDGEEPFEATLLDPVSGADGSVAIPVKSVVTVVARLSGWRELRLTVRYLKTPLGVWTNPRALISAVAAKGMLVSGGVVRETKRFLMWTRVTAVRIPRGTQLVIKITANTSFGCLGSDEEAR